MEEELRLPYFGFISDKYGMKRFIKVESDHFIMIDMSCLPSVDIRNYPISGFRPGGYDKMLSTYQSIKEEEYIEALNQVKDLISKLD